MDQLPLHLSIAFFGIQVAAWTGLGVYLYATRRRRSDANLVPILTDAPVGAESLA